MEKVPKRLVSRVGLKRSDYQDVLYILLVDPTVLIAKFCLYVPAINPSSESQENSVRFYRMILKCQLGNGSVKDGLLVLELIIIGLFCSGVIYKRKNFIAAHQIAAIQSDTSNHAIHNKFIDSFNVEGSYAKTDGVIDPTRSSEKKLC